MMREISRIKTGAALVVAMLAGTASAQLTGVSGVIVDQKGYKLRNVIVAADGLFDTTDLDGKFGAGRGPVVGVRGASRAPGADVSLAGSRLRFSGLGRGASLRAGLMLASGRRAGISAALSAPGGRAELDLDALAAGLPREGLYVLRTEAGQDVRHHLLARVGGGSWILSSQDAAAPAQAATALRKAAAPAKIIVSKPGYESKEIDVPAGGDVGTVSIKLDPTATTLEAPFDVAPLWYPTGWAGDYLSVKAADETAAIRMGDPDAKCTKWTYQADINNAPLGWAAVIWQYPENNWGAKSGRKVLGARKITFWARGEAGAEAVDFKTGNDTYMTEPDPGMFKDTYGAAIHEALTTEWKQYEIPLDGSNTEMVISGFVWAATMGNEGAPVTFYIDEVRFE